MFLHATLLNTKPYNNIKSLFQFLAPKHNLLASPMWEHNKLAKEYIGWYPLLMINIALWNPIRFIDGKWQIS